MDSCAAAATGESDDEVREFGDEDHGEHGARKPNKLQDPGCRPRRRSGSMRSRTCRKEHGARTASGARGSRGSTSRRRTSRASGIHLDYCFMGKAEDVRPKCIVVAKDRETRMVMSSVVPMKGTASEFPARRIRAFISELGCEHVEIIMKSDQEPAIVDLVREVARIRAPAKTMTEQSPVGASASNGVIERGILTAEGQIRVMKDALEARIAGKIPSDHRLLAWLVEFAAVLVNRYEVGHDGKTPYERCRGKKSKLLGLEFGEFLNFRWSRAPGRLARLDCLWEDGIFLGYRSSSGEVIVGTRDGGLQDEDGAAQGRAAPMEQQELGARRRGAVADESGTRRRRNGHAGDRYADEGAGGDP